MADKIRRTDRIKLAIHDHGTRPGATPKKVMDALVKEGFDREEISKAIEGWLANE